MLMPNNLPIETLQPIVLIESIDDLEVSFSSTNIEAETDDNIIGLSEAVGRASNEVSQTADFLLKTKLKYNSTNRGRGKGYGDELSNRESRGHGRGCSDEPSNCESRGCNRGCG
ncbi:17588_t:CDS:2, partial [Funneliformis caledonium]